MQVIAARHCNFRPQAADVVHHLNHASVIARDNLRQERFNQSAKLLCLNMRYQKTCTSSKIFTCERDCACLCRVEYKVRRVEPQKGGRPPRSQGQCSTWLSLQRAEYSVWPEVNFGQIEYDNVHRYRLCTIMQRVLT